MASSSDYRCVECGCVREFVFDYTPPHTVTGKLGKCEHFDCQGVWKRVWSAPHTGRGSSGEPPR